MICSGLQCPNCKDVIYSRAGHDFHYCTCGECFVDGGQETYGGRSGWTNKLPKSVRIDIPGVEKVDLIRDWNHRINKYGTIKSGVIDLSQRVFTDDPVRPETEPGSDGVDLREGDTAPVRKKRLASTSSSSASKKKRGAAKPV